MWRTWLKGLNSTQEGSTKKIEFINFNGLKNIGLDAFFCLGI